MGTGIHATRARIPATLDEARRLVAYHQRTIEASASWLQVERAKKALAATMPHVERLEQQEIAAQAPRVPDGGEYDVLWNGAIYRQTGLQPSNVGRR